MSGSLQMGNSSLAELLEESRKLSSKANRAAGIRDLPNIELGLDQIESQSRRLANKHRSEGPQDSRGHYLLSHGGVDPHRFNTALNAVGEIQTAFAPLQPLPDNDIDSLLKHHHEQIIISAIEETRRSTVKSFYRDLDQRMRDDWEKAKEDVFEELGRHTIPRDGRSFSGGSSGGPTTISRGRTNTVQDVEMMHQLEDGSSLQTHSRMMRYDRAVRRLNNCRKGKEPLGLVNCLADASISSSRDPKSNQLSALWRLMSHIVGEENITQGTQIVERQYATAYLNESPESHSNQALQSKIASGGRAFLEEQFIRHVENHLAQRASEANLGGDPSIQNKIRAYVQLKLSKQGAWINPNLELIDNFPIWARAFYLLRAGQAEQALDYIIENQMALKQRDRSIITYFRAWLDNEDRRLPKQLRDSFLTDYNNNIRHLGDKSDPYKYALYKLIGRTEFTRRNIPGITDTTDDWLWLQLYLVRETEAAGEGPHERYTLRDLSKLLVKFGEAHFDPKGNKPLDYFRVLLLCGQFERAIDFLHLRQQYWVDAVHFAIALTYYGLLRVPEQNKSSEIDLLTVEVDASGYETTYLNFAKLIHRYQRQFAQASTAEALQYILLINLNAKCTSPIGEEQRLLCHTYIKELVAETQKYAELLGSLQLRDRKTPGELDTYSDLLLLDQNKTLKSTIVKEVAEKADREKRFKDALLLYNLAGEYDAVVRVINTELGNSLSRLPIYASATATSTTGGGGASLSMQTDDNTTNPELFLSSNEDVVGNAEAILRYYQEDRIIWSSVLRRTAETCEILLQIKHAFNAFAQGRYKEALNTIENTNVVPLSGDLVLIIRRAEEFKDADNALTYNFDNVLITTMQILQKLYKELKESPYGDISRQSQMTEIRQKARSLMTFAGMLRFKLSGDTYATLTALDVSLH